MGDFLVLRNMTTVTEKVGARFDVCPVPPGTGGKVNLKLVAQEYETAGFPGPATREGLRERYRGNSDQRAIDLYALGVPAARNVVGIALGKRGERAPHGLVSELQTGYRTVEYFVSGDPYSQLRENMTSTLFQATEEYFEPDNLERQFRANPHARRNHDVFTILAEDHVGGVEPFIRQGFVTSSNIMPATLRLIPDLMRWQFHEQPAPETATQVARDNYPFLSRMAIMHLVPFIDFTDNTVGGRQKKPFTIQDFEYKENTRYPSGLELQFNETTQEDLRRVIRAASNDPLFRLRLRLGCIAAHSDALRSLWDWHVDIAEETIYPQQLRQTDFAPLQVGWNPSRLRRT